MPLPSRLLTLHFEARRTFRTTDNQLLGTCNGADIDDWELQTIGRLCWRLLSIRAATFSGGTREQWAAVIRPKVANLCWLRPLKICQESQEISVL